MRISDWSADVCASDLGDDPAQGGGAQGVGGELGGDPEPLVVDGDQCEDVLDGLTAVLDRGQVCLEGSGQCAAHRLGLLLPDGQEELVARGEVEIGSASWRARVCPYVQITVVAG